MSGHKRYEQFDAKAINNSFKKNTALKKIQINKKEIT